MAENHPSPVQRLTSNLDVAPLFLRSLVRGFRSRDQFVNVRTFCLFVGYPRSGHSMVGSLLNAHPDVVISHELDVLRYVDLRFRREQLYHLILERDRAFAAAGRSVKQRGFDYNVPHEWQGRYRTLSVIGDKRGNSSIRRLHKHPDVLHRLRRTVGVELRIIHVARNPFDNITTMANRARCGLDKAIDRYFRSCSAIEQMKSTAPGEVFDTSHEALIADPAQCLTSLCAFLGVDAAPTYLDHCASVVYRRPSRTRDDGEWTSQQIEMVERRIGEFDFLEGYSYAGK